MKIHSFLSLAIILIAGSKSYTCGTSYPLPVGSVSPQSVDFSPDGSHLATANDLSNDVTLFSVGFGGVLKGGTSYALPPGSKGAWRVTFSPNGSCLATANKDSNDITTFAVTEGVLSSGTSYTLHSTPSSVAFSPDGSYLAIADNRGSVTLFNVTGSALRGGSMYRLPSGSGSPWSIAFSPDGLYLATANMTSDNVTLFSISGGVLSGGVSYSLPSGSLTPISLTFSPNGSRLATANFSSNDVTIFTVSGGTLSKGISYSVPSSSPYPQSIAFSPDGSYLAVTSNARGNGSGDVTLFSFVDGVPSEGTSYALPSGSSNGAFSSNGSYFATANSQSNDVTIFDTKTRCATSICNLACASIIGTGIISGAALTIFACILKHRSSTIPQDQTALVNAEHSAAQEL